MMIIHVWLVAKERQVVEHFEQQGETISLSYESHQMGQFIMGDWVGGVVVSGG